METQTKISRYGVSRVEPTLAHDAPGPLPRRDPPKATSGFRRRCGARLPRNNATGQTTSDQDKSEQNIKAGSGEVKDKSCRQKGNLNILQLNISGFSTKKTELSHFLHKHNIHVALLQETEKGKDADLHLTGYTYEHCNCDKCQGVATYIRNDITGSTTNISNGHPTDVQKTTIWHNNRKYQLYNVYNPPGNDLLLPEILNITDFHNTILAGDFNGHSPLWGYNDHNPTGEKVEEIKNTTNLLLVQDKNSEPTLLHRVHKTLSRPDLTLISADLQSQFESKVSEAVGNSDHRPIVSTIHTTQRKKFQQRTRWNFKKASWDIYQVTSDKLLKEVDMTSNDENKIGKNITSAIKKAAELSIPRGCRKKYSPFWNQNLDLAVQAREKARKRLEENPNIPNQIAYNRASAEAKRLINVSKREKFQNTCANLDLNKDGNKVWSLIDNLSGESRVKNPKPVNTLDGKIVDDKGKAHAHNKFFAMVNKSSKLNEADKELLKELHSKEKAPRANEEAFETDFTHREMKKALKKLKHRKAPGPDGLHNEMLKRLGTEGKKVLLEYINITLRKENLPFEWISAVVKPILKKNKPAEELSSYRPISLTSCLCKVAERMVNGRLYWWLEANKLLDPHQAGFRSKHRTDDQLFRLSQKVIDGFHKEQNTTAVFVDLKQAYDRVWRKGLLLKMQRLGIHGKMYKWIKNYLSDRIIQTRVNHETSSKQVLEEGLPQGSSLSCTLFLIFINDLPGQLKYGKALYADDLVLWHTHKQIGISARLLNEDLKRLEEYCKKWKLKINCNKTVYTIFTKSPKIADKTVHLEIDGMPLEKESNPVYLGVTLDRQFTLNDQMKKLSEKSTRRLKIIKRLASTIWGADKKTLRQLYIGYVRSSMEYNLPLQAISSDTTQKNLDKIESQAVHFISGGMRSAPTAACQIDADIMPLRLRREAAVVEMVERYRRTDENHPNAKIVNSWKQNDRIQQKSILKVEASLKEKYNMPENREQEIIVNKDLPPFKNLKEPTIKQETLVPISKKNSDEIEVRRAGLETIYSYQDFEVQVYTDGSATKGTSKGGYGARIEFHDGTCQTIAQPCGLYCSNFEAEAKPITSAIDKTG